MASYPDDWGFELEIYPIYNENDFTIKSMSTEVYVTVGEYFPESSLPITSNTNVVWYYDQAYTIPILGTIFNEDIYPYVDIYYEGNSVTEGTLCIYGRIESSFTEEGTIEQKTKISFKKGTYENYLFNNSDDNHIDHSIGTLYLADAGNFTTSYLFYDDGQNFLNVSPLMVNEVNGGVGRDLTLIPPYATLIQGADQLTIDFIESAQGAYYSTGASASPQFGTLPVNCGGTGNTTFTANRPIYSSSTSKLASATSHYMSTTKFAVGTVTAPSTTFYVNGTSTLKGNTSIKGTLSATGAVSFDSTLNTIGDATFNTVNMNGMVTIDNDLLVTGESSFQGTVIIDNTTYGTDLPTSGTEGQIFFKLIE